MKIEHVMSGYAGTLGGYLLALTDTMMREGDRVRPSLRVDQYPFFKRFMAQQHGNYLESEFYDLLDSTKKFHGTVKKLREEGRIEELDAYVKTRGGLASIRKELNFLNRRLSSYRKQKEIIQSNQNLDPDLRRDMIEQLDKEINQVLHLVPEYKRIADRPAFNTPGY